MSPHLDRDQLVRWRDHGSADRAAVLGHLAACDSCAARYAELVRTAPLAAAPVHFDPADFVARGYSVRERVARRERAAAPARASSWIEALWHPPVSLARAALFANVALVLLLAAVALPRPGGPAFTTLSGPPPATAGVRVTVIFQPIVTELDMRQALLDVSGSIVAGPSAVGVYVVQLSVRPEDDPAVQAAIDALRANNRVVQFAERQP